MKISSTACSDVSASTRVEQGSQRKDALVLVAAGVMCIVPIVALTASAFIAAPHSELPGDDCVAAVPDSQAADDGTAAEMWVLAQAFILGWACCLAAKFFHKNGAMVYASCSAALRSSVERMQAEAVAKKEAMVVVGAGIVCTAPIVVLIVSAFTATPDSEAGDDGLASEGSLAVRAFTIGWIVCLALKLVRELVGLVGGSSCMALLSC